MAGVVQPSCHSCHKLYFPFTHVDVFLTTSAILHFFYRIPIKNLIHLLSNHSQLPSSPPTKLPLLPPSSRWRGCSRTPFGRRSWCNGVVEINYLFKVIKPKNGCGQMKTLFSVDNQMNKLFYSLVLRYHADNRGFGKVVCPCIDGLFFPFFS